MLAGAEALKEERPGEIEDEQHGREVEEHEPDHVDPAVSPSPTILAVQSPEPIEAPAGLSSKEQQEGHPEASALEQAWGAQQHQLQDHVNPSPVDSGDSRDDATYHSARSELSTGDIDPDDHRSEASADGAQEMRATDEDVAAHSSGGSPPAIDESAAEVPAAEGSPQAAGHPEEMEQEEEGAGDES